jgi:phage repressor protein C with HTH and peptisase S24 domain
VRDTLRSITSIENLVTLIAYGTSMEPTFRDGSILLVDRGVRAVTIDGVYVLSMDNQLYVKRVTRRLPDGALVVTSDNSAYARSVIENGERSQVEVLGRVVWSFDSKVV